MHCSLYRRRTVGKRAKSTSGDAAGLVLSSINATSQISLKDTILIFKKIPVRYKKTIIFEDTAYFVEDTLLRTFLPRCIFTTLLSVCPSVKRVHCDKAEEKLVQIFIPYERSFSLVFWEEWLVGATHSTWNYESTGSRWSGIADFKPIFARSASAVTPSEKSLINTNRKSTMRFSMSLRWSSYVAPKPRKNGSKPHNCRFQSKITLPFWAITNSP